MITYLNLCLSLHKAREAKDGLHQYRNLSQSQAPGSLEKVIRYLMDAAEKKCTDAKASADALADAVLDEDSAEASSHILLSNMSADPTKTQRDTALLLPSLKFLWETYRAVLDILKSNSKLEHVYHAAAMGALKFCRTYKRRTRSFDVYVICCVCTWVTCKSIDSCNPSSMKPIRRAKMER
jgi:translation initiation factor 3 subunit A